LRCKVCSKSVPLCGPASKEPSSSSTVEISGRSVALWYALLPISESDEYMEEPEEDAVYLDRRDVLVD
jgi:hypothetical protein